MDKGAADTFEEYKAFLFRGNLLDLAVAFILGVAFNSVVDSLANDVIMAPIASAVGFDEVAAWRVGGVAVGSFLAALLNFIVIATVLFAVLKAAARSNVAGKDDEPIPTDEAVLLGEIRDLLQAGPGGPAPRSELAAP